MRSVRRCADQAQECLPFDVPLVQREPRPASPVPREVLRLRLRNDALASRGMPAGTELLVDPSRRPRRGEVALVREGGRLKIGVFDLQLGRRVLRSDRGATWLGASARVVGVVTVAGAPLSGMPDAVG